MPPTELATIHVQAWNLARAQLVNFKDDEYEVTTATTEDEIKALGKAGFIKYDEHNGIHFYRKPKRFVSLA